MRLDNEGRDCEGCGKYLPWSEYHKQASHRRKYGNKCRDCREMPKLTTGVIMRDEAGKDCSVCRKHLPWAEFNKGITKDGHDNRCKACLKLYRQSKNYKEANKERSKADYADPVKKAAQIARMAEYHSRPEVKARIQTEEDRTRQHERAKQWRTKNIDRARKTAKRNMRKWMKNPRNRLSNIMSRSIYNSLDKGAKDQQHWEKLVPYTLDELRKHLESKFEPAMTWENHTVDGWHIDHILPLRVFEFSKPTDQGFQDCWKLENLMPRWATTKIAKRYNSEQMGNLNKSSKILDQEATVVKSDM